MRPYVERTESEHQLRLQKLEEAKRAAERQVIGTCTIGLTDTKM